ncbi:MAG: FHIPEP family type III secretion protein [Deltaproteobacteria bacterium]|nr:FHIPEP family type III secretion protein [Deltaproteobacteria bacterium]
MDRLQKSLGQVLIVLLLMVVVSTVLISVSPIWVDVMQALNFVLAFVVLATAALGSGLFPFKNFPAFLLIATLFRLALNISSTRLILSTGNGGDLMRFCGEMITAGHVATGFVVFLVLLIVQFLIVAKGGERVAEVSARFTLDALPGKQMSIDADLRAGLISSEQAQEKRSKLIQESRFFGAMDGAMRFVKGDVFAGFLITALNLVGGFFVSWLSFNNDPGKAMTNIAILTIGDGVLAQIPSMLLSVAAAILVTRVCDEGDKHNLAEELGMSLFAEPKFWVAASVLLFCMGLFFSVSFFVFGGLALVVGTVGIVMMLVKKHEGLEEQKIVVPANEGLSKDLEPQSDFDIEFASDILEAINDDLHWQTLFHRFFPEHLAQMQRNSGVLFPVPKPRLNIGLKAGQARVLIKGVVVWFGSIDFNASQNSGYDRERFAKLVLSLAYTNAHEFISLQTVKDALNTLQKVKPDLVQEVVPRLITLIKFTNIVKRLVEESVPVGDLSLVLEHLAHAQPGQKSVVDLVELVRVGLGRQITQHFQGQGKINCFVLDPEIEDQINQAIRKEDDDVYLTLCESDQSAIIAAVKEAYKRHRTTPQKTILVTDVIVRRLVRQILVHDFPLVRVLSYQELPATAEMDIQDTVSLHDVSESLKCETQRQRLEMQ